MESKVGRKLDVVVKYFYPVAAGIETNILETYKVLATMGWDITIHTSDYDYTTGQTLAQKENIQGLNVVRYKMQWPTFRPQIDWKNTDLVCLHNFDILPHLFLMLQILVHKITGTKNYASVLTPHGGFNPEWRVFGKLEAAIKYLYQYTLGVVLINLTIDGIRAVSEWERTEMAKKGVNPKKIHVISNGLENEAFMDIDAMASIKIKEQVKSYGRYIIQIGRIYPIKNYETTINAMPLIPSDVNFVIVGPVSDQNYLNSLKAQAESLGVANRVIFAGVLRGIDKYYVLRQAQMMVHMALYESFGNVLHEALGQGIPLIAADNTAINYLVKDGENGFLVPTHDHAKVAERINFVLDPANKELITKMSADNVNAAKDSSWTRTAEKMHDLYITLTGGKK
jgi:glycosyltransferase involved in cell wall biosynthesis